MRFLAILALALSLIAPAMAAPAHPVKFPVAPHSDVTIEWWYLNAHVATKEGRHLAMVCSFFRFGNAGGQVAMDSTAKTPQSHYLIWAVTDEDAKKHVAYSLGDKNTLDLLREAVTLELAQDPSNRQAAALLGILSNDELPPPNRVISGAAHIDPSPFAAVYGSAGSVSAVAGERNTYRLTLDTGEDKLGLSFAGEKPPMYVGGSGDTGIDKPTDMHYVSLTRCRVTGTIEGQPVASGEGWFDHQWGDSWTTQHVGWDWWGVQLDDGTDINFFRMRDLATGRIFMPLATFEDENGKLTVTKNIGFEPNPVPWHSPRSGVSYPLSWNVTFPDQHMALAITPDVEDQEMPVLAGGGYIWEGSCHVTADMQYGLPIGGRRLLVQGVAYQELVGYGAPAVRAKMRALAGK